MNLSARFIFACVSLTVSIAMAQANEEENAAIVSGEIQKVTLYRDQAMVSRAIPVKGGAGLQVLHVPELPQHIVAESVFAEGDENTTVRAVRVATRPVSQSNREEIRELDDQIVDLQKQRDSTQSEVQVNEANLKQLEQLITFTAAGGKADLSRGVLDAETLTALVEFASAQRKELAKERFDLDGKLAGLTSEIGFHEARKRELTTGSFVGASYEAKIYVETAGEADGEVRLNYIVTNCGWSPQYTIRGKAEQGKVELSYSALVQQLSGEDWNRVQLTLSTASPSINALGPRLTPFRVTIETPENANAKDPFASPQADAAQISSFGGKALSQKIQSLREQQQQAEVVQAKTGGERPRDVRLNAIGGQMQQIELLATATSWRTMPDDVNNDMASQTYHLQQPVSLMTRRQQQMVQILTATMDAEMYHVATPLLSSFAYREAKMKNTGAGLLSGPASVYLDERFVGRMQVPSTATGQQLTVGFGADQQVRTRRELLDKQDEVQGGNRRLRFVHRLVVNNFKDTPVTLRLIDRMPITREQQQVSVTLDDPQEALSEDGLYQRVERPMGILRWDLTVPEGRHGSKAYDVQYSYTAEFDRSKVLSAKNMLEQMQVDLESMMLPSGAGGGFGGGMGGGMGGMGGLGGGAP